VSAAVDLVAAPLWGDARPLLVVSSELGTRLRAAGLVRVGYRALAVKRLAEGRPEAGVVDAGTDSAFLDVLLAGYEVDGVIAAFIAAEHRIPAVRRFLALVDDVPIAAAAMTIHGDVAVLGGASTLRSQRGHGAQSRLLRHRLQVANEAGCTLAVATATVDSVSAGNLGRAGFRILRRSVWAKRP
jgi:GNAT superfamily N-acetyltransferase